MGRKIGRLIDVSLVLITNRKVWELYVGNINQDPEMDGKRERGRERERETEGESDE